MENYQISVESSERQDGQFICTCFDQLLGDATIDRIVSEGELIKQLNGDVRTGMVEIVETDISGDEMIREVPLNYWLDANSRSDLHSELAGIINKREGRTKRPPVKPLNTSDFLPVKTCTNSLNKST